MAKSFITERDIDDMKARGITSVDLNDNVVITDLAVERAMRNGMRINRQEHSPAPMATFSPSVNTLTSKPVERLASNAEVIAKVKAAVLARLDGQVDAALLEAVITRVVIAMK
jgi:hypothetical protein